MPRACTAKWSGLAAAKRGRHAARNKSTVPPTLHQNRLSKEGGAARKPASRNVYYLQ